MRIVVFVVVFFTKGKANVRTSSKTRPTVNTSFFGKHVVIKIVLYYSNLNKLDLVGIVWVVVVFFFIRDFIGVNGNDSFG